MPLRMLVKIASPLAERTMRDGIFFITRRCFLMPLTDFSSTVCSIPSTMVAGNQWGADEVEGGDGPVKARRMRAAFSISTGKSPVVGQNRSLPTYGDGMGRESVFGSMRRGITVK